MKNKQKQLKIKEKKQVDTLKDLKPKEKTKSIEGIFPEGYESVEIKNELNKIKEYEKNVKRNNIIYYSSKEPFDFRIFKTVKSFGKDIHSGKITINEADQKQVDLIEYILNFNNKARPKKKDGKKNEKYVLNTAQNLYDGRELVINDFNSRLFSLKSIIETGLKILTPKQMP